MKERAVGVKGMPTFVSGKGALLTIKDLGARDPRMELGAKLGSSAEINLKP